MASSLTEFLAQRALSKTSAPSPASENPSPAGLPMAATPGRQQGLLERGVRKVTGHVLNHALQGTGRPGQAIVDRVRGQSSSGGVSRSTGVAAYAGTADDIDLSQPGNEPQFQPLTPVSKPAEIEKQVLRLDRQQKTYADYFTTEVKHIRSDIKNVSTVAAKAVRDLEAMRKNATASAFKNTVRRQQLRGPDGRFITAGQAAVWDAVKPSQYDEKPNPNSINDLLGLLGLGKYAGIGGAGVLGLAGAAKLKGAVSKLAGQGTAKAAQTAETDVLQMLEKNAAKGAAEKASGSVMGRVAGTIAKGKGSSIGTAAALLQTMKEDSQNGNPIRTWLRKQLGIKDEGEAAPWAGAMSNEDYAKAKADAEKDKDKDKGDVKTPDNKSDDADINGDEISLMSRKDFKLESKNDMFITAKNELTIKARKLTLDAEKIVVKILGKEVNLGDAVLTGPGPNPSPGQSSQTSGDQPGFWSRLSTKISNLTGGAISPGGSYSSPGRSGSRAAPGGNGDISTAIDVAHGGGSAAAVDLALKEAGLHESKDREALIQYLKHGGVGLDPAQTAWCAAFVNSSLEQSGVHGTRSLAANSFQKWGTGVDAQSIRKGDIMVQEHHVGMATGNVKRDRDGNITGIEMISGNYGNRVNEHTWTRPGEYDYRRATAKEDPDGFKEDGTERTPEERAAYIEKMKKEGGSPSGEKPGTSEGMTDDGLAKYRDKQWAELENNPLLKERMLQISLGENPDKRANQAVIETIFNRAAARGTSLEHEMREVSEGGYYPATTFSGGERNLNSERLRKMAEENLLNVRSGGNVSKYATDNSSGGLALADTIGGQHGQYGREGLRPGRFTLSDDEGANLGGSGEMGRPGVESFLTPGWGGGRDKYEEWRRQIDKLRGPTAKPLATSDAAPAEQPAVDPLAKFGANPDIKTRMSDDYMAAQDDKWFGAPSKKSDASPVQELDAPAPKLTEDALKDLVALRTKKITDADLVRNVPPPPNLQTNDDPDAGQKLTDQIKDEATDKKGDQTGKPGATNPTAATNSSAAHHQIQAPVHHPESEGPRPGSDGYGDQQHDVDDCGLCSV